MLKEYVPTSGEFITPQEAAAMTAKYRDKNPNKVKAHYLGKTKIQQLLDQSGAVGIRIYYGIDETNKQQVILVGVNSSGNDILSLILDRGMPCPSDCSEQNILNSQEGC
jgi:hypothetical protein